MKLEEIILNYPESCANCLNFRVYRIDDRPVARCTKKLHENRIWTLRQDYNDVPKGWLTAGCEHFLPAE